jgi:hypothetical protein
LHLAALLVVSSNLVNFVSISDKAAFTSAAVTFILVLFNFIFLYFLSISIFGNVSI